MPVNPARVLPARRSESGHNAGARGLQSVHASCVALEGAAVLLTGPPGVGKSELALRLIDAGFVLVADDRVCLDGDRASAPPALAGLIELRGIGILRLPCLSGARVILHVALGARAARLPEPDRSDLVDCVRVTMEGGHPAAVSRVRAALLACRGVYGWVSGAGEVPGEVSGEVRGEAEGAAPERVPEGPHE